ncbi:hypothetical protein [Promicromonospora kroppenstedtii]|uniref:hypothetical protein n=1 Tax=Promicromonospora kroppenstedtii TaxID=440482 RepID=UPI0004B82C34|nr:hypothetical protein [Promicromonospora kroppenstedtii]
MNPTPLANVLFPPLSPLKRTQLAILLALRDRPMYEGTVPAHVKARRRAANKAARVARRGNR